MPGFSLGLDSRRELAQRVSALIQALGAAGFRQRENAQKDLIRTASKKHESWRDTFFPGAIDEVNDSMTCPPNYDRRSSPASAAPGKRGFRWQFQS